MMSKAEAYVFTRRSMRRMLARMESTKSTSFFASTISKGHIRKR